MMTTASIAIISTLGLTYLLDNYKNRQDQNLRDELKDRVTCMLQAQEQKLEELT